MYIQIHQQDRNSAILGSRIKNLQIRHANKNNWKHNRTRYEELNIDDSPTISTASIDRSIRSRVESESTGRDEDFSLPV